MNTKMKVRMLSFLLCFVMLIGLMPTSVFAAGTKLETPQNLKLQGTVLSWDAVDNADYYSVHLYYQNYQHNIGIWQTDGTSFNLYKYLKDGETYGATVIACSNGSYQISAPAEIPLTACTNAGVPIYRDVNVVNGTSSVSTAYPGMSVRLEAKPAPDGMVFDRWELSGGYINIGYSDTDTVIYVQAICDNDISARSTYKYQENVTSAFTVQPQGGAALVGESFDVTYAMNFTPQGTVKVQVEGNTSGVFTDLKQGEIDSASIKEDSVVTKTFRIMAFDGTRNIYSDEFVVSWEDGPRFVSQPMGGTVDHNVDFVATYALNFTPFSCRVERYNDYLGQWSELSFASATQATISSYDFNTSSIYRIKAIIEGGGEVYSDEFTVTWSDAVSKFIQQPVSGTVGFDEDFTFTFAINFTPASNVAIQKYNSGFDSWDTVGYCTSLTSGTISGYASETTNKYRLEAYENGTPIHSNEFTVTWEGTDYTVSFAANGGSGTMADVNNVSSEYTLPACGFTAPNGQRFKAWLVGGNEKAVGDKITVTANTTVTAIWEAVEYNVTVTSGTASVGAGTPITKATMGTTVTLIAGQALAGQEFDKWVVNGVVVADANSATTTFVMPAGNVTATATYKNISVGNHPVTITMKDGDDVNSAYTDVQNLALELLAYKGLLVEDAQVTGFRNNAGKLLFTMNNNFIVLQDGLTEQDYIHYTLTPQEVAEIKSYYGADITEVHLTFPSKCVVSFETNGGSSVSKLNLYIGDKVTKPADPTKPYFALAGWYSDSGLTQAFDFNQPITGDITLYAKWTPSPVGGMFLMTIDLNGGTSLMPLTGEVPANSSIYLEENLGNYVTPPSGKVLAGYEIDGVPYAAGGDYLVTHNFTLKFLWKDVPAGHTCDIKPVAKVDPTCTEDGKEAYYKCEGCGKFYEDALGTKEITDFAAWGNLDKLGHKDDNKDGKCDVCTHDVGTATGNTNNDVQSPQTGDNNMMWLWSALLFITGLGVVATTATDKKKKFTK